MVAHPPCQRWGRFWHGSTAKPHQFEMGDDGGCFAAALDAVRAFGGVLEHPADSHAWSAFGIPKPPRGGGWIPAGGEDRWTCCVYQGHYGHFAGKGTWLYAARVKREDLPNLTWGKTEQRIHPRALELHGYEKARRIGMVAMIGGKNKTKIRNATPTCFRDVLLGIARSVSNQKESQNDIDEAIEQLLTWQRQGYGKAKIRIYSDLSPETYPEGRLIFHHESQNPGSYDEGFGNWVEFS